MSILHLKEELMGIRKITERGKVFEEKREFLTTLEQYKKKYSVRPTYRGLFPNARPIFTGTYEECVQHYIELASDKNNEHWQRTDPGARWVFMLEIYTPAGAKVEYELRSENI